MLSRLWPRALRYPIERRQEKAKLAAIPGAVLDAHNLRAALPDYASYAAEWSQVEGIQASVGLVDPAGGVNHGDRRLIYQITRALAARSVLEVGTHVGASTLMLALAVARNGGTLTTVDIADVNAEDGAWKRCGCRQNPRAALQLAGVSADFHQSDSVKWLAGDRNTYNLIFLDGLHEAQQLYRELPLALARLRPEGLILLHDVFPNFAPLWADGAVIPGPWMAIERYVQEAAPIRVQPLGALPWPTKLGSTVTSLAAVLSA